MNYSANCCLKLENKDIIRLLDEFYKIKLSDDKLSALQILYSIYIAIFVNNDIKITKSKLNFLVKEFKTYRQKDLEKLKPFADRSENEPRCNCAKNIVCTLTFTSFRDIVFRRIYAKLSNNIISASKYNVESGGDYLSSSSSYSNSYLGGAAANDSFFSFGGIDI